ncbi:hypothetical protein ACQR1Y_12395 [Bradyrhizobium sp. HKCCYLRH3099]|uniref:hypothetical protein n=1 Tax=Bradyrhizobium TaxID=374 RepID=UPI003EB87FAE
MSEIKQQMARENRVTVASITAELDRAAALAERIEQPAAMTTAIATKAKLHGLLVERRETGAPGDFAAAQSEAEVVAAVREQLGDEAAEALLVLIKPRSGGRSGGTIELPEPTIIDNIEQSD